MVKSPTSKNVKKIILTKKITSEISLIKSRHNLNDVSKKCILYILQNDNIYDEIIDYIDGCILERISPELKNNREIVSAAIIQSFELEFDFALPKFQNDKNLILYFARCNKLDLEYVPEQFKDDKDIVLAAINQIPKINTAKFLKEASLKLQNDKKFLIECYKINSFIKEFIKK
jgi:hypothetical protein